MLKNKKYLIFCGILSFFMILGSVSATDYYVNDNISASNINSWINVHAKTGDNLIFNISSYNLTDTINIKKSINVKSSVNTKINFYKNKDLFNVSKTGVSFSGLTLNHYGNGNSKEAYCVINSNLSSTLKINISNTVINLNGNYLGGVYIENWEGKILNCEIKNTKSGPFYLGVISKKAKVNIINSKIIITGTLSNNKLYSFGITIRDWKGNLQNSIVSLTGNKISVPVSSDKWSGKVENSNIVANGNSLAGFVSVNSKGTISKSNISAKKGFAILVSDKVTVKNVKAVSKKGYSKIYRYRPDLVLSTKVPKYGYSYYIVVSNNGILPAKASYLNVKVRGKFSKNYYVKALSPGKSVRIKVTIPKKYANTKYTKIVTVDAKKRIKELSETNTWIIKF